MKVTAALAWMLAFVALSPVAAAQTPAPPPARSGCDSPESRQLDFWVGKWVVTVKGKPGVKVADSLIEKLYGGCAVRENWAPLKGGAGGSLSAYVPGDHGWRQTWLDTTGSWVEFKGGRIGPAMVIEGVWPQPGHPTQLTRMTYTHLPDGAVEQAGQTSDDQGATWQPSFDFIYRRA